jgi:ABC-type antimicrobial peptide transport system permease subunit
LVYWCKCRVPNNLFAIRERKYEIGVLRAIGMQNKSHLLLIGEMLILALIAAVIAIVAGPCQSASY